MNSAVYRGAKDALGSLGMTLSILRRAKSAEKRRNGKLTMQLA